MTLRQPRSVAPARRSERGTVLLLIVGIVWAAALATQYVAWRFAYHWHLGAPWMVPSPALIPMLRGGALALLAAGLVVLAVRRGRWVLLPAVILAVSLSLASLAPIYPPYRLFVWYAAYHRYPALLPILYAGWWVFVGVALLVSGAIIGVRRGRRRRPTQSHGSAAWGDGDELLTGDDRDTSAFVLGRGDTGSLLRYAGDGHLLTIAPTRSGKGIGCVIPNLLAYEGAVVVTDVKGELYPITARHREQKLEQRVHALDPFRVLEGRSGAPPPMRHAFNPLDLVDTSDDHAIDNARLIADMLVVGQAHTGELAFWDEEARSLLTGLILYVAVFNDAPPAQVDSSPPACPPRTLCGVRRVLTDPPAVLNQHLAWMALQTQWVGGLVARTAARMAQKADRERSGVISCAQNHTHFLDSPRMQTVLSESTVDLRRLTVERMSVYFILPYERLDGYGRWVRLMVACALMAVVASSTRPEPRVLFMLDEFEALGQLPVVQRAIALAGGFGAAFWLFLQDLAQLKGTYPEKWGTFLANVDVFQCFGTNDLETAEYVSRMVGDATIMVESDSQSTGISHGRSSASQEGNAITTSETARRLLLPDEVRRLPKDQQVLFVKGCAPILARRINYLCDEFFATKADPNPLYAIAGAAA